MGLRKDTAAWVKEIEGGYELEPHHKRLLLMAAEAWDRSREARDALDKHGLTYVDRYKQPRARPEVQIEAQARIAFARLMRELALDVDPPKEPGRPPVIGANRGLKRGG